MNAFILYKEHCKSFRQKPKLQREFRIGYAKALVEDAGHEYEHDNIYNFFIQDI